MKVVLIAAVTADGFIARQNKDLADWSSSEDKRFFRQLTTDIGTMIMGATTFQTIGKALPNRRTIVYSHQSIDNPGITTTDAAPVDLIAQLAAADTPAVAIVGGRSIYDLFLAARLVDEVYLTVEPVLFGNGVPLLANSCDIELQLLDTININDNTIVLHYKVKR